MNDFNYFGAIPLYEKNAIQIMALSKIQKNTLTHSEQVYFTKILPIENRPLKNPSAIRIPASFLQKTETVWDKEIKEQREVIRAAVKNKSENHFCFESDLPVKSKIVSQFGSYRRLPNGVEYFHTGLDLRARTGTPIYAAADGVVQLARFFHIPGNAVIIDHGNTLFSKYYHLSEIRVAEGSVVKKGTLIGLAGGTGRVEAPHLHWEMSWNGYPTDPIEFLKVSSEICQKTLAKHF